MKKKSGPTIKIQTVLDTFKLFFANKIIDQIVLHTNLYAKRYFDKNIRSCQDSNNIRLDSHFWKPVDKDKDRTIEKETNFFSTQFYQLCMSIYELISTVLLIECIDRSLFSILYSFWIFFIKCGTYIYEQRI